MILADLLSRKIWREALGLESSICLKMFHLLIDQCPGITDSMMNSLFYSGLCGCFLSPSGLQNCSARIVKRCICCDTRSGFGIIDISYSFVLNKLVSLLVFVLGLDSKGLRFQSVCQCFLALTPKGTEESKSQFLYYWVLNRELKESELKCSQILPIHISIV